MSDKPFSELSALDQRLRRELPVGMLNGTQLRIEKIVGFELFNTRPYHNHETWSDGYSIVGPVTGAWSSRLGEVLERYTADVIASTIQSAETGEDPVALLARYTDARSREKRAVLNAASGAMSSLLRVQREDLDAAIDAWFDAREKVIEILAEDPPQENQRTRLAVLGYHYSQDGSEEPSETSSSPTSS